MTSFKRGLILLGLSIAISTGVFVFLEFFLHAKLVSVSIGLGIAATAAAVVCFIETSLNRTYNFPPWAQFAVWFIGVIMVIWSILIFFESKYGINPLSYQVQGLLLTMASMFLSGLLFGACSLLLISGVISKKHRK